MYFACGALRADPRTSAVITVMPSAFPFDVDPDFRYKPPDGVAMNCGAGHGIREMRFT
jgi:hypothetical protein